MNSRRICAETRDAREFIPMRHGNRVRGPGFPRNREVDDEARDICCFV